MGASAPDSIKRLVDLFDRDRKVFLSADYKGEQLRLEFLNPFFTALGWNLDNTLDTFRARNWGSVPLSPHGAFAVDDPRDPDRMILNQYSVASSEMVMIYRGSAVLGSNGRAEVALPSYFNGLCRNPMVQLTGVGSADVVYVAEDVLGNHFTVGGKLGMKVYWTVTAERKDPTAEMGRTLLPVEQAKTGALAGRSLDDASLAGAKKQLERLGLAADFDFRTAAGRQRYENAKLARTLDLRDHARAKVTDKRQASRQRIEERRRLSAERKAARRPLRKAEQHDGRRKSGIPTLR
jgi:hypothetical protein